MWNTIKEEEKRGKTKIHDVSYRCDRQITAYATKEPLKVLATFSAWIEVVDYAKPRVFAQFFVVGGAGQALLGKHTACEMKLLKLGVTVNHIQEKSATQSKESVDEFPKVPNYQVKFDIDPNVVTKRNPHYRVPLAMEESVNKRLKEMHRLGVIERAPETSEYMSPMEVVMKGKDDYRLVIDMREVNKAIQRAHYPLPNMTKFHQNLAGAKFFTKIDIKSAFHHLELHPDSRSATTFMTSRGPMRFKRLLFGVNTAPEIFQRLMERLLRDCKGVIVFIDDILVHARTLEELNLRVGIVMNILRSNNLTLNEEKCQYNLTEVEFIGYRIDAQGLRPTSEKIQAVKNFRKPHTIAELRSFLGLLTFLSPFIRNFASKTEPLRELVRKYSEWSWGQRQDEAFMQIKKSIIDNVQTHGFFQTKARTVMFTDASMVGLGAVLCQLQQDNSWQVIEFASKTLTDVERRYPQTQREALAVVWAVEKFHYYLLGNKFTILTDHRALEFIYNGKHRDGKRAMTRAEGWALRLEAYDFDIKYVPGEKNIADPLSRMCEQKDEAYAESDRNQELCRIEISLNELNEGGQALTVKDIRDAGEHDEEIQAIKDAMVSDKWPESVQRYQPFADELRVTKGVLLRNHQIVVPAELRHRALEISHTSHPGAVTMKRALRDRVWWSGLDADVASHIKGCLSCTMVARDDPPEPMKRTEMPRGPWEFVAIDFYSPTELKEKILVITDYYSRLVQCLPVRTNDSNETTKALDQTFRVLGYPARMQADNGSPFQSDAFSGWCTQRGIDLVHSAPYWAQQNGQVERMMKNLTRAIATAKVEKKDWKPALQDFVQAYNSRPHSTTQETPNKLMFNRNLRGLLPMWETERNNLDEETRDQDKISKFNGKKLMDKKRHAKVSDKQVGDFVLIHSKATGKLAPRFDNTEYEVINRSGGELTLRGPHQNIVKRNVAHVKKIPELKEVATFSPRKEGEEAMIRDPNEDEAVTSEAQEPTCKRMKMTGSNEAPKEPRPKRNTKPPNKFIATLEEVLNQ